MSANSTDDTLCGDAPAATPCRPAAPRAFGPDAYVGGVNDLALDLHRRLPGGTGVNAVASAKNVADCLGTAYLGAAGATAEALAAACRFPPPADGPREPARLAAVLDGEVARSARPGCSLTEALGVWARRGLPLSRDYLDDLRLLYMAEFREADFAGSAGRAHAAEEVNAWAAEATSGLVRGLVTPEAFDPASALALVSAVHFKGDWEEAFEPGLTADEDFLSPSGRVPCRMMHRRGRAYHHAADLFEVACLPYAGGPWRMAVFLPRPGRGLAEVEAALTGESFRRAVRSARSVEAVLSLPRWRAEAGYDLRGPLTEMGAGVAFSPAADFSGMLRPGSAERLCVGAVVHRAAVDVSEAGTEAAAATAAVLVRCSAPLVASPPVTFRADRPFLYAIYHAPTAVIMFLGRVVRPEGC